jgi:hypothetical protein
MRRLAPVATLFLAACATTPPPPAPVEPPKPAVVEKPETGTLIGLTSNELVSRLGTPRLQIREGQGTKLQFAVPACILDAYLYPSAPGGGVQRVTHVDTRNRQGTDVNQQNCITAIEAR